MVLGPFRALGFLMAGDKGLGVHGMGVRILTIIEMTTRCKVIKKHLGCKTGGKTNLLIRYNQNLMTFKLFTEIGSFKDNSVHQQMWLRLSPRSTMEVWMRVREWVGRGAGVSVALKKTTESLRV